MTDPPRKTVVTDACVLINLIHVGRLSMCGSLPGLEFVVPDHVRNEIRDAPQRAILDEAIARGELRVEMITDLDSIGLFAKLTQHVGRGEASCLALAVEKGCVLASDEKRRFRREAEKHIGKDRIIGTKELYLLAIGEGLLSVEEADVDKTALEQRRFRMDFNSFREIVQ